MDDGWTVIGGTWRHPEHKGWRIRLVLDAAADAYVYQVTLNGRQTRTFAFTDQGFGYATAYIANRDKIIKMTHAQDPAARTPA